MADSKGFEVLVDELTIHKAVRELKHPITGEPMGWQQGNGETWFLGEVVPATAINPEWVEALESGEGELYEALKDKLAPSSDEPAVSEAVRMGMPFEGYGEMDESDILAAMRVLPSAAVMRIKEWESAHEGRDQIVNFNIGYGVAPMDYQEGNVPGGSDDAEQDDTKPVRAIRTRKVEEGEPTVFGEGITGTGDPAVLPGTEAAEDEDDANTDVSVRLPRPKGDKDKSGGGGTGRRAGRRPRPKTPPQQSEGGGSTTPPSGDGS